METSCSQLGKGKRRRKHKSQDVSDNSDSDPQRMTSPPSITISHDIRTVFAHVNLSIHKNEKRNYNNINTEKDIVIIEGGGNFNDNNGTSTNVDEVDKEVQENNIAAIMTTRDENFTIPGYIIIEDLQTDNHVILKILHNVLATRKMDET
ncbi:uncharacterized protein LOC105248825 isoform X1 [Camponotus floridanus]|uniref:uncharacterized protein LOC105248825 isoform X1 n=1 Tax=Camponotus floridanus TaxID=104421 RepID=UPI000DC6B354|nr:uncharacterized protein LOC105248825 isoform X1 [Camponotus floridanus]